jgi:hypothetical protein
VVRTRRSGGARLLLTQAQAQAFDKERERQAARNDALRRAQNIGASGADFERKEGELTKQWGFAPPRDVFWALAGQAAVAAMKKGDWHHLSMIYWEQARLVFEEGKDCLEIRREAEKAQLRGYAEQGVKYVRILAGHSCSSCTPDNGHRFSVSEALEKMPIPKDNCENGWCACTWSPLV